MYIAKWCSEDPGVTPDEIQPCCTDHILYAWTQQDAAAQILQDTRGYLGYFSSAWESTRATFEFTQSLDQTLDLRHVLQPYE